jgi:hypothetical protein
MAKRVGPTEREALRELVERWRASGKTAAIAYRWGLWYEFGATQRVARSRPRGRGGGSSRRGPGRRSRCSCASAAPPTPTRSSPTPGRCSKRRARADACATSRSRRMAKVLILRVDLAFTFVAIFTVDRVGRRELMLFGAAGLAVIYTLLGAATRRGARASTSCCWWWPPSPASPAHLARSPGW